MFSWYVLCILNMKWLNGDLTLTTNSILLSSPHWGELISGCNHTHSSSSGAAGWMDGWMDGDGAGSPALRRDVPGDAAYRSCRLQLQASAGAEDTGALRCALRTSCVSAPYLRTDGSDAGAHQQRHIVTFFSVPWRRIFSVVLLFLSLVLITMDIYTSALSPALDIGTGCYLLVVGE